MNAIEPKDQQQGGGHFDPDLRRVEQQRRREGEDAPSRQHLARSIREVASRQAQRRPGQQRGECRHDEHRAAAACDAVRNGEHQWQQEVVAGVDLAGGTVRIAELRLDRAIEEAARVAVAIVVGEVGVAIEHQAVGDQQVVGLVAIGRTMLHGPRDEAGVHQERQPEKDRARAWRQMTAQERPRPLQHARSPVGKDEQQPHRDQRIGRGEPEARRSRGGDSQRAERAQERCRLAPVECRQLVLPHPALDRPRRAERERQQDERRAEEIAAAGGKRPRSLPAPIAPASSGAAYRAAARIVIAPAPDERA